MSSTSTTGKDLEAISSDEIPVVACENCQAHSGLIKHLKTIERILIRADERAATTRRWGRLMVPILAAALSVLGKYWFDSIRDMKKELFQLRRETATSHASAPIPQDPPLTFAAGTSTITSTNIVR